ncbi:hypothetical protein AVKW3434_02780 [Acidovorax sp. SUPP3434]|uniref:hypothetical protein n=1 Tax=Acidovorax sp. SUPP3434 TaxID=2920880 RepID=UPI0023DE39E9|nr:hypothetical protein [Acidovorax sp. SUPP3434]GKS98266.1 hypothetical protein AVKW3434_02780 [Acidovorax sp. SUPP3434]
MTPARPQPLPHRRRIAVWWIAFALLLAPLLGRMHQVVHGVAPGLASASVSWPAGVAHHATAPDARPGQGGDALHALFAGHHGADCQLLDQLLLSGALLAALVLPTVHGAAQAPLPEHASHTGTRQRSAFLARAPPARG